MTIFPRLVSPNISASSDNLYSSMVIAVKSQLYLAKHSTNVALQKWDDGSLVILHELGDAECLFPP
jgi:hypothetical protein